MVVCRHRRDVRDEPPARLMWLLLAVASASVASAPVNASERSPEALVDRLSMPMHGTWRRSTVADVAAQVAADGGVPVAIDRRIDFTRRIDLDGDARSLAAVLDELADKAGGAAVLHGACVRIAPPEAAARAFASADSRGRRLAVLPKTARHALAAEAPLTVEAGDRPRDVVERLLAEAMLEADGLELIHDDHLPAATFPSMPLVDRIDTVLAHYGLAIGSARGKEGTARVAVAAADDGDVPPPPRLATLAPTTAGSRPVPIDRFTLRTDAALDELLTVLAKRFGLRLSLDLESLARKGVAAKEIVKLSVRDVSRDALLDAVTRPLGLEWTVDGDRLVVR